MKEKRDNMMFHKINGADLFQEGKKDIKSSLRSNSHCTNLPPEVWNEIMGWKINDNIVLTTNTLADTITIRRERRSE